MRFGWKHYAVGLALSMGFHAAVFASLSQSPERKPESEKELRLSLRPLEMAVPQEPVVQPVKPPPPEPPPPPPPKPPEPEVVKLPDPEPQPEPEPVEQPVEEPPVQLAAVREEVLVEKEIVNEPPPPPPVDWAAYEASLVSWLERHQLYPRSARQRRMEGEVWLRIELGADGGVVAYDVAQSSGFAMLDQAALDMVRRADPFPPLPPRNDESREYVIPVLFALR